MTAKVGPGSPGFLDFEVTCYMLVFLGCQWRQSHDLFMMGFWGFPIGWSPAPVTCPWFQRSSNVDCSTFWEQSRCICHGSEARDVLKTPQKGAGFFPDDQHYSRLCNFDYGHWYSLIKFPTWPTYSLSSFIASRILLLPRMWLQRARWNTWSALVEGDGRHIWSPDEWKHWPFRSNFLTLGFQNLGFLFSF